MRATGKKGSKTFDINPKSKKIPEKEKKNAIINLNNYF